MDNDCVYTCTICLKTSYNNLEPMERYGNVGLPFVELNINLAITDEDTLCYSCTDDLQNLFNFKKGSWHIEQRISLLSEQENDNKVDLRRIYSRLCPTNQYITNILDSDVCRFCLKVLKDDLVIYLNNNDVLKGQSIYFPELDLNNTKNPTICVSCHERFKHCVSFLQNNFIHEEQIKETEGIGEDHHVVLTKVITLTPRKGLGTKSVCDSPTLDKVEIDYEDEIVENAVNENDFMEIQSKVEIIEENVFTSEQYISTLREFDDWKLSQSVSESLPNNSKESSNNAAQTSETVITVSNTNKPNTHEYDVSLQKNNSHSVVLNSETQNQLFDSPDHNTVLGETTFNCGICNYQTKQKPCIEKHILSHGSATETQMYKCDKCDFQTKNKDYLPHHMLLHESFQAIYMCVDCDYQTKRKNNLTQHTLTHKKKSDVALYECDECPFKSKYKAALKVHAVNHKSDSQVKKYKCGVCTYKTKRKDNLRIHERTHKSSGREFECNLCDHKCRNKSDLGKHKLTHGPSSEIIKCDKCTFETKHMGSLKRHKLTHENEPKKIMYKCGKCKYETVRKDNLRVHERSHNSCTEKYTCDRCGYTARHKISLEKHMVTHGYSLEVTLYKCDNCKFATRHKGSLKVHSLIHKSASKVKMYKCDICSYETRRRDNLRAHKSTHEIRQKHECEICGYEARLKSCLEKHKLTHEGSLGSYNDKCDYRSKSENNLSLQKVSCQKARKELYINLSTARVAIN